MKAIDLHTHTCKSDGSYTPTELVDYAIEKNLAAVAVTDHDSIEGLDEAVLHAAALRERGLPSVEVIPGIEFSTKYQKQDVHIVGLYISYKKETFQKALGGFVDSRVSRNKKMCENLRGAGIDITYERLLAMYPDAVITRAHYASFLLERGHVKSRQDAFARYLGDHTKYFVPREKVTPSQAVELILKADGIPILAHPPLYHMGNDRLETLVSTLKEDGLMGVEVFYSTYSNQDMRDMQRLSEKYDLLISGGSDFHGANKPGLDLGCGYGKLYVPEEVLHKIKAALPKEI